MNEYRDNVSYSLLLFARPSFWEGIARIFDFGGALQVYNRSKSEGAADTNAIRSDWRAVGQDISNAIEEYGDEPRIKAAAASQRAGKD